MSREDQATREARPQSFRARLRHCYGIATNSPFVKHNAIFFGGSLAVAFLNYLFYPILGRMLQPADYGEVQTLTSLFTQAAIFLSILTYVTIHVTVNVPDETERNRILLGLERLAMIVGYALLVIALLLVGQLKSFLHFRQIWPFIALIVALALSIPQAFRQAFLRGRRQFFKVSLLGVIGSGAKLVLGPLLVLIGWRSFGAIAGIALAQFITLIYCFVWARRAGFSGSGIRAERVGFKSLVPQLRHAVSILLVSGGITIMQTLDIVSIKHYFSPYQSGLYAGVTTIAGIIYFLMTPIVGVLVTHVSLKQPLAKNRLQLQGSLGLMFLLGGGALLIMALVPELTIKLLIGSKYLTYAHYLPRIGLVMLLLALANGIIMYHVALSRYHYSFVVPLGLIISLALIYISHHSIGAIINDLLIGAAAVLIFTVTQSLFLQTRET